MSLVAVSDTNVLPHDCTVDYPLIVRGEGVRLYDADGAEYLDAMSGGSMAATIGYGVREVIDAATRQAEQLAYVYNHHFTNPAQEQLARDLVAVAPPGFTRVHLGSGGAEANEAALRLARAYHLERGEPQRVHVISPAQSYHGPTVATLALTGRPGLHAPVGPFLPHFHHIPPATRHLDPTGAQALEALDRLLEELGPDAVAAFYCEPVSAASLPAYTPPEAFWQGLEERRQAHGFLVCFDEVVTGLGRTGTWFAADRTPLRPDVIATGKGLGAGYAALSATLCTDEVFAAIAGGSGCFDHGHTWDGAPLPCAVGVAVLRHLREHDLVGAVDRRAPGLLAGLRDALSAFDIVGEVRGHGFLLGVEYVDPADGTSFPDPSLRIAARIDAEAMRRGLVLLSTQPTADGFAADQSLFAPAFTATDADLDTMVERFAEVVATVDAAVKQELVRAGGDR